MRVGSWFEGLSSSPKFKNKALIIIAAMIISVLIDSQIGIIADFIPDYISSLLGILLYVGLTIFLILSSFYIIYHVKNIEKLT